MLPDESRSKEPCAPDISFQLARTNEHSDEKPPRRQFIHAHLQNITFSRFRDAANPFRTENLALLAWDKLDKILAEARMTSVRVVIDLPAENTYHIAAYERLQEAILTKMPVRGASAEDDHLFRRDGWQEVAQNQASSTSHATSPSPHTAGVVTTS